MTSPLLVATDLSSRSDRAIDRAALLAAERAAPLTVLHAVDDDLPAALANQRAEGAKAELTALVSRLEERHGIAVNLEVAFGTPHLVVHSVAARIGASLLVLGTHREGISGFRGTALERVIRSGALPCLVVARRAVAAYERVVLGVDFSTHARRAIQFCLSFLPEAELRLVHACRIPYSGFIHGGREMSKSDESAFLAEVGGELDSFLAGFGGRLSREDCRIELGTPQDVLRLQVADMDAQLAVVGTHGRTGISRAVLGSVAEDLVGNPPCDVLVAKAW